MIHRSNFKPDDGLSITVNRILDIDGASSTVSCRLCIPVEEFSYTDFLMIATDVLHDFRYENACVVMNFTVDL